MYWYLRGSRKPFLVYDKKSNKSFSYSRHGQNYEHFLLPFPSFSNQSCLLIQLFLLFDIKVGPFFDWNERIPNCQTHHVNSSPLYSQFFCTLDWTFPFYFPSSRDGPCKVRSCIPLKSILFTLPLKSLWLFASVWSKTIRNTGGVGGAEQTFKLD